MEEQGDTQGQQQLVEQEHVQQEHAEREHAEQEHAEQEHADISTDAAEGGDSSAYTQYQHPGMPGGVSATEYVAEQQDQPQQHQDHHQQQLLEGQEGPAGDEACNSVHVARRGVPDILCPGGALVRNRGALTAAAMQRCASSRH